MPVSIYEDKIRVEDKRSALKYLILLRCHQKDINLSMADIDVLIELHETGYGEEFYRNCVDKGYFKSMQTVVNSVGKMTKLEVLWYEKKGERFINREFFPELSEDKILVKYMISNT